MIASAAALIGGVAAGAAIGAITRSVETSRLAFGPYALYGNGALVVPVILAPIAIFIGWAWPIRAWGYGWPVAAYTLGMIAGPALGYAALIGQPPSAMLLSFGMFIVPTAVFAALTISALRSRRLRASTPAIIAAFIGGTLLAAIPPFSFAGGIGVNGISVAAAVVASERATVAAVVGLGIAVALVALVQSFALPLLLGPFLMPG